MNMKTLLLAGALVAMAMSGNSIAQDCAGCQSGCATGNCGTAGPMVGGYQSYDSFGAGVGQFGYPGSSFGGVDASCGTCGVSGGGCSCKQHLKQSWAHTKAINQRVMARNRVWPKPFDCADRQLYFSIWEPMLDAGYEKHCTLTQAHFAKDSNELNDYGKSAVAGVMRNMPKHRKTIFIHRDVDQQIADSRMNAVRNVVSTWYGSESNASIAFTDKFPTKSSGERAEVLNRLYTEGAAPPIIPVATGAGGVGSSN